MKPLHPSHLKMEVQAMQQLTVIVKENRTVGLPQAGDRLILLILFFCPLFFFFFSGGYSKGGIAAIDPGSVTCLL